MGIRTPGSPDNPPPLVRRSRRAWGGRHGRTAAPLSFWPGRMRDQLGPRVACSGKGLERSPKLFDPPGPLPSVVSGAPAGFEPAASASDKPCLSAHTRRAWGVIRRGSTVLFHSELRGTPIQPSCSSFPAVDPAGLEPATSRLEFDNPPPSARAVADEVWRRNSALPAELQAHLSVHKDGWCVARNARRDSNPRPLD